MFTIAVTRNFLEYEDEKHSSSDLTTLYIFSANAHDISSCGMNWSSVTMATTVSYIKAVSSGFIAGWLLKFMNKLIFNCFPFLFSVI